MLKGSILLNDDYNTISSKIKGAMAREMDRVLNRMIQGLVPEVRKLVYGLLMSQPEIYSVSNSELKHHFGLSDGERRIENIIQHWCNNIIITKVPVVYNGRKMVGGLVINAIKSDYIDVLGLPEAHLSTDKGVDLEWLRWLLLMGNRVIVKKYDVRLNRTKRSRSGSGLMIATKKGGWSVPPQFSGTATNNFVIRALTDIELPLTSLINKQLQKI